VKIFSVSKLDKKWRNMYRLTSFGCRSPWARRGLGKSGISLIPAGMFPDDATSFPVKVQKIPCSDAQGISEYRVETAELFGAFAWARNTKRAKFPVSSQLAGNSRATEDPNTEDAARRLSGFDSRLLTPQSPHKTQSFHHQFAELTLYEIEMLSG
jgi:hypothetical protein